MTEFETAVLNLLQQIPKGKVTTYADIAKALGRPKAARAVGNALNKNTSLIVIPCHRVVCANGDIGGYAGGVTMKKKILKQEGVTCTNNKILDFQSKRVTTLHG